MKIYDSTHNFFRGRDNNDSIKNLIKYNKGTEIENIEVVKNEEFGFFVSFTVEDESFINLGKEYDLGWWGLDKRFRITVESDIEVEPYLVDYVVDDDGIEKADIIKNEKSGSYPKGEVPIFIEGKVLSSFRGDSSEITVKIYSSNGYEREKLIQEEKIKVSVIDFNLSMDIDDGFYLDLWQHPCSWARAYGVEYFSDKHFRIIEKYIKEMSNLGQKVIDLVVSDFPWAGQMCFAIKNNPSRLYEYNIVNVKRKNGKLFFDFKNMEKYIRLCMDYGIKDEINIFGIIGNWHGYDFGSPIEGYRDPIRVKVFDEDRKVYDFIRTKKELKEYIKAIFDFIDGLGLLSITKVIGDEPSSNEVFVEFSRFLEKAAERQLNFKYALHSNSFFEDYTGEMDSFSMNTRLLSEYCVDGNLVGKLGENVQKMTWYSCCFPEKFNIFIKSPLIESRYIGVYTYLWNLKGMLRWAYGIYVENIYENITYKPEKWSAGDMFFVYPGKDGEVVHSLREKNMLYSIQDFNIFRNLDNKGFKLRDKLKKYMKISGKISPKDTNIEMEEFCNINSYKEIRNTIIKSFID